MTFHSLSHVVSVVSTVQHEEFGSTYSPNDGRAPLFVIKKRAPMILVKEP